VAPQSLSGGQGEVRWGITTPYDHTSPEGEHYALRKYRMMLWLR
jgi:hypothetical protein